MATRKPSDIIKTVKNTARSYKDKHNAELRLEELLQKLDLPKPVTVGDIKDIIWNMPDDSKGASVLFSQLASYTKNRQTVEELKQVVTDAWNYFPHRLLGGKSPIDLAKESQETGSIDKIKYKPLPQRGRPFSDVFAQIYPKHVSFENIDEETWGWIFPKQYHDFMDDLWRLEEQGASRDVWEKALYWMIKQMPEFFYAVNLLAQWHGEKQEFDVVQQLYEYTIAKARTHIPATFVRPRDRVRWTYRGNRDFLDLLYGYATFIDASGYVNEAIKCYEEILAFNPGEEQEVRGLLATAYLKAQKPEYVIGLTAYFPRDSLPEMVMGALLAFIQQGDLAIAKEMIKEVQVKQRNLVKELLKSTHVAPLTLLPRESVTRGSEEEAYYFWQAQGKLWEQTPGAIDFLRRETRDMR